MVRYMRKDELDRFRVKRIQISRGDIFRALILTKTKEFHVVKGLPEGCVVQEVYYDPMTRSFWFIVQHEDFPVIKEGEIIPELDERFLVRMEYDLYDPDEAMR